MKLDDRLIVLHYTRYGENAVVLHTLSRTWGRRSFMVRNASRTIAFFQPLALLDCVVTENPKSKLMGAGNFSNAAALSGIRNSAGKNAISMFMAEVLLRCFQEGMEENGIFEWCQGEILLLDALKADYSNFHIRFLLDLAAAMGFSPSYEDLLPFMEDSAAKMLCFIQNDEASSMLIPMSGKERAALCGRLLKYLEFHLETPVHIRSLSILQELF